MATLTNQSVAASYEQLLHVDRDGGGNSTTHVSVKDGDNETTFGFTIASDALMMTSTNRLEFGDTGTYINQSSDGVLNITSDTEVEINATSVDLNGTLDISGTLTVGADGSGTDVIFYSGTAGDNFTWDASEEKLTITGTNGQTALDIADGNLVVADNIDLEGDIDVNGTANLDAVDIDGAVNMAADLTMGANILMADDTSIGISDSDERIEFDASGDISVLGANLGIGTSSPADLLHVSASALSGREDNGNTVAIIERNDHAYLQISTPSGSQGGILFGDDGDSAIGYVAYDHSSDILNLRAGGHIGIKLDANSRTSLSNNDSGTSNTIFGKLAGDDLASGGNYNVLIGEDAGHTNKLGDNNIAIGYDAFDLSYIDDTQDALTVDNIFIGKDAGGGDWATAASHSNIGIGSSVMDAAMNGALGNTVVGHSAGSAITTSDGNTAIGFEALKAEDVGSGNTALGYQALETLDNDTGYNVAIGYDAMQACAGAYYNVAIGRDAGKNISGSVGASVIIGYEAGDGAITQDGQVLIGRSAGGAITSGADNVAVGYQALQHITTGHNCMAIGKGALSGATAANAIDSDYNMAIGTLSMSGDWANVKSEKNLCIGVSTMDGVLNGADFNTAVGHWSLNGCSSGEKNATLGFEAGKDISSGGENVAIGHLAGNTGTTDLSTGSQNTLLGASTISGATGAANRTVVGYGVTGQADNSVTLGNASVTAVYAAQDGDAVVYCGGINMSLNQPAAAAGSMSSEHLDHYEEGTWTPTLTDGTDVAVAHSDNGGNYTKIGRLVTIQARVRTSDLTDAGTSNEVNGNITIGGLPFANSSTKKNAAFSFSLGGGLNITEGESVTGDIDNGSSVIYLRVWNATGGTSTMQASEWTDDGDVVLTGSYFSA